MALEVLTALPVVRLGLLAARAVGQGIGGMQEPFEEVLLAVLLGERPLGVAAAALRVGRQDIAVEDIALLHDSSPSSPVSSRARRDVADGSPPCPFGTTRVRARAGSS